MPNQPVYPNFDAPDPVLQEWERRDRELRELRQQQIQAQQEQIYLVRRAQAQNLAVNAYPDFLMYGQAQLGVPGARVPVPADPFQPLVPEAFPQMEYIQMTEEDMHRFRAGGGIPHRVEFQYENEPKAEIPEEDREVKVVNNFLVGCDPEFAVLDAKGALVNVKGVLQAGGPIGFDHGGRVVELRPRPAKSAFTLTKHLWDILKSYKHPGRFRAGAYFDCPDGSKVSLGGHVHLDVPFKEKDFICRYQILALDELTTNLEALDILPQKESEKRRSANWGMAGFNVYYGALGDVRSAATANRMEYRTMASWLFSPITSFLCLTGAKIAAAHPKEAIRLLGFDGHSKNKLQKFFEAFQEKDVDAKRIVEKVFEKGLKLQRDPALHVMDTWNAELATLGG